MRKLLLWVVLSSCVGRAGVLHVVQDTSLLIGNPAAPFYAEFQFNDGSGTGDGNNTVTLSNFKFDTGGPGLTLVANGGASGSMDVGVQLIDSDFFNDLYQEFSPGNTLSFNLNFTGAVDPGPQPDQFTFSILDCSQTEIPTTSPANALLSVDIAARPVVKTFSGNRSGTLGCNGGPAIGIPAPVVTELPEPASGGTALGTLLCGCLALWRNRKREVRNRAEKFQGASPLLQGFVNLDIENGRSEAEEGCH